MPAPTWIKICGVTLPVDVEVIVGAGAHAVGFNFVPWSKRCIDVPLAQKLVKAVRGRIETVGVVSDLSIEQILELSRVVGLDRVQIHGHESPEFLTRLGGLAFKAIGVSGALDVAVAASFPGDLLLVDAVVGARSGGTGTVFDWSLVTELCRSRRVVVAGGLHPGNVMDAVVALSPFGVDVASGVELAGNPGVKDEGLVKAFVAAVRRGDAQRDRVRSTTAH